MLPKPFLLALAFRSLTLLFPQTNFQPDEFYQVLEPAHRHVFGYGYLTWEWRDLPDGGRLRGWLWPSIFIVVYRFLQMTGLDDTRLLVCLEGRAALIIGIDASYGRGRRGRRDGLGDLPLVF
jgi:phosphatidylinositol glycan class B